jgi:hypothetical protein
MGEAKYQKYFVRLKFRIIIATISLSANKID